jgi:hypothetical protein
MGITTLRIVEAFDLIGHIRLVPDVAGSARRADDAAIGHQSSSPERISPSATSPFRSPILI